MAKRAYGQDEKRARREAILDAASRLFGDGLCALPSVAAIAEAAGLAKGTVYLYFRTKEAIFSALLLQGWSKVIDLLEQVLAPSRGSTAPVDAFLSAYVAYLDRNRQLLRLDAMRPALERNLEPDTLITFKRDFMERLVEGGAIIETTLGLDGGRGIQLLVRTHALTCGLWQSLGPDTEIASASEFAMFHPDFPDELSQALAEYWRGALGEHERVTVSH